MHRVGLNPRLSHTLIAACKPYCVEVISGRVAPVTAPLGGTHTKRQLLEAVVDDDDDANANDRVLRFEDGASMTVGEWRAIDLRRRPLESESIDDGARRRILFELSATEAPPADLSEVFNGSRNDCVRLLPRVHCPLGHYEELSSIYFGHDVDPDPLIAQFDACLVAIAASPSRALDDRQANRQQLIAAFEKQLEDAQSTLVALKSTMGENHGSLSGFPADHRTRTPADGGAPHFVSCGFVPECARCPPGHWHDSANRQTDDIAWCGTCEIQDAGDANALVSAFQTAFDDEDDFVLNMSNLWSAVTKSPLLSPTTSTSFGGIRAQPAGIGTWLTDAAVLALFVCLSMCIMCTAVGSALCGEMAPQSAVSDDCLYYQNGTVVFVNTAFLDSYFYNNYNLDPGVINSDTARIFTLPDSIDNTNYYNSELCCSDHLQRG
ncbi:hypothetical protein CYMTET_16587 [Cymbomonas tetramitiformis]|uniref:Uncharacterized protein n=1 Tax=Cymbomonas tetramitiformis TaxID=36881 RepID=A0AAE0GBV6_9CHLO|nr:hypothetical protein CYMTET_16587 [Cymbomonas tetramitiformis]